MYVLLEIIYSCDGEDTNICCVSANKDKIIERMHEYEAKHKFLSKIHAEWYNPKTHAKIREKFPHIKLPIFRVPPRCPSGLKEIPQVIIEERKHIEEYNNNLAAKYSADLAKRTKNVAEYLWTHTAKIYGAYFTDVYPTIEMAVHLDVEMKSFQTQIKWEIIEIDEI